MPEVNLAEWIDNGSKLLVSDDLMQAEIYLCPPPVKQEYTPDLLKAYLSSKRIQHGVKEELLSGLLAKKLYYKKVTVALGTPVKDGEDGSFQFLFDTETKKTPKVLPDGSVDYRTMANIPTVKEGAIIARYHSATVGSDGMNLYGGVIPARSGKDLPELKGKGFCVSEDRRTYMATISGKIELENGRINIKNFLEIKEDVDLLTGDIDFDGDVLIHGNVSGGRRVRAGGNLTIEGCVEACELYAGKDIVLARGMQGGGRGVAECRGSLSGKFFEQMRITAGRNVSANSILNCQVEAGVDVEVAGRHGAILGGSIFAGHWIQATTVGNIAEVQSELIAGDSDGLNSQMQQLEAEYRQLGEQMHKTKHVLELFQARKSQENDKESQFSQERRMQVTRMKISLDSKINENVQKRQRILEKLELAEEAKISIRQSAYPGTKVRINGAKYQFREVLTGIVLKKYETDIRLFAE